MAILHEKHHCQREKHDEKDEVASSVHLVTSPLQPVSHTCFITGKSGCREPIVIAEQKTGVLINGHVLRTSYLMTIKQAFVKPDVLTSHAAGKAAVIQRTLT